MRILSRALCSMAVVCLIAATAAGEILQLDFETPALGDAQRAIQDPYRSRGVAFDVAPEAVEDAVVGLVQNHATSACVNPPDLNQKLGTGRLAYGPDGDIGRSGYPIQARFDPLLQPIEGELFVEVQFQVLSSTTVMLTLLNDDGQVVGSGERLADAAGSTCGNPGNLRSRVILRVNAASSVRFARMHVEPSNRVFVVDDFRFGQIATIETTTWSRIKSFYLP